VIEDRCRVLVSDLARKLSASEFDVLADRFKVSETSVKKKTEMDGENKEVLFPGDVPAPEGCKERELFREKLMNKVQTQTLASVSTCL